MNNIKWIIVIIIDLLKDDNELWKFDFNFTSLKGFLKNSVFNFKLIKILILLLYFSIIISNLTLLFLFLKSVNESKQSSFYLFYYVTSSYLVKNKCLNLSMTWNLTRKKLQKRDTIKIISGFYLSLNINSGFQYCMSERFKILSEIETVIKAGA